MRQKQNIYTKINDKIIKKYIFIQEEEWIMRNLLDRNNVVKWKVYKK